MCVGFHVRRCNVAVHEKPGQGENYLHGALFDTIAAFSHFHPECPTLFIISLTSEQYHYHRKNTSQEMTAEKMSTFSFLTSGHIKDHLKIDI